MLITRLVDALGLGQVITLGPEAVAADQGRHVQQRLGQVGLLVLLLFHFDHLEVVVFQSRFERDVLLCHSFRVRIIVADRSLGEESGCTRA